jgi:Iodothyronine deiodinase
MKSNVEEGICYPQPRSTADRIKIANDFVKSFHFPIPMLVDDITNPADRMFAGWPERLYILQADGVIAYKGKPGPFGFAPEEVASWLEKAFPEP